MKTNEITGAELYRGRHGDAPGVRSPRKRRAGARRGSAPLAVLLALVMALAFPARARADGVLPSSGWQPLTFYEQDRGADGTFYCVTNSASDFNTALHLIGRMSDYLQLSNEQLAKLSNEGSGGRFYQLAKSFESAAGWNEDTNLPNEFSIAMGAVDAAGILYGYGNTWWGTVTSELLQGARADYMVIYNGGSLGGGGVDSSVLNAYYVYGSMSSYNVTFGGSDKYTFGVNVNSVINSNPMLFPENASVIYNNAWFQNTNIDLTQYDLIIRIGGSNASPISFYLVPSGHFSLNTSQFEFNGSYYTRCDGFTIDGPYYSSNGNYTDSNGSHVGMYMASLMSISGNTLTFTGFNDTTRINMVYSSTGYTASGTWGYITSTSGGGGGGGDNNWPGPTDEPEPGPPDPPSEPTDPVGGPIDWPDPYNPTTPVPGPEPTPTTPVSNPTNTSPADYTPWLMAILSELRGIHTDMNAWLDAIFEGIVDYGAAICSHIDTASENVRSTLRFMTQWMDEQLDTSFYQLRHLLWECANYIADSLDYTFVGPDVNVPGYDDSSVLYWLKRIYFKLGSGNVNTRPVDPVADHDNWWDWIVQLIKNLILDLGMMGADFLSDMGDVLSEVVQKFPFSIPWDIAAYLTAFSTQPVTPVIVITIPAMSGFLPQTQFTIDLHPYDDAMATVRAVETIVFAFWLMWKCPMLLDMMDTAKWGI